MKSSKSNKPLLSTSRPPVTLENSVYSRRLLTLAGRGACLHLDIGAGTGANVAFANKFGLRSIALEYDPDYAREMPVTATRATADLLPFPAETFDIVTIIHVLEHLPSYLQTISEIRRVLKPGGYLIIEVPSKYTLQELLNYLYGKAVLNEKNRHLGHCNYFTYSSLRRLLENAGFTIDDERIWGGLLSSTFRAVMDILMRGLLKGVIHQGRFNVQDNDRIERLHRKLSIYYKPLRSIDQQINHHTHKFIEVIGFVCRREDGYTVSVPLEYTSK